MKSRIAALVATAFLVACSPVSQQTSVSTPVGQSQTVGIGDVMLRAESRESMPNAFGNADLFGRTRPTGISTVQYGGLRSGRAVLLRSGATISSTATTMNSTAMILPTQSTSSASGYIAGQPFNASGSSTGMAYIPPAGSTTTSAQQPTIPIEVDWRANPRVPIAGKMLVIERADAVSVTFSVE